MPNNGIMSDKSVAGGDSRRSVDRAMSETFGGYRTGGNGVYANYVEPVLHATEHTARAVAYGNGAEWKRAKDELRSVGNGGLRAMAEQKNSGGPCYQNGNYPPPPKK